MTDSIQRSHFPPARARACDWQQENNAEVYKSRFRVGVDAQLRSYLGLQFVVNEFVEEILDSIG